MLKGIISKKDVVANVSYVKREKSLFFLFFWIHKIKYAYNTNFIKNGSTLDQIFLKDIKVLCSFQKSEKFSKKLVFDLWFRFKWGYKKF